MSPAIPKILGHIWIGPKRPPVDWMNSWRRMHPGWHYRLYDNKYLQERKFTTQRQIDEYRKRGQYAGIADLMRLEILYETGGLLAAADSICLHSLDELFTRKCAYTVYENEYVRGKLVSPIHACEPGNPFVKLMIEELAEVHPDDLDLPWISTGNLFTAKMIDAHSPEIIIFPSHFLIPIHYTGMVYDGEGKVYAKQMFASTRSSYPEPLLEKAITYAIDLQRRLYNKRKMREVTRRKFEIFRK